MPGLIPEETLQMIRDRISLVDLVSSYVNLRQTGRNHVGLCPFHNEKTPSFSVSDERGFFKCFGCGAGGNAFSFLMQIERIEFPEAVEQLAKRAGVALPERTQDGPEKKTREMLVELHEKAAVFYRKTWASDQASTARSYLNDRGLGDETIERYGIGFAPAGGKELTTWFGRNKVSRRAAVQSGLVAERDGRLYDRFRGRIMFPIRDRRGRVIAFGGRALGDEQPKYLNSPETPIFTKGEGLYGVSEAREAIRDANRVVLVEGYMDALMLVQAGIEYVVATLGTALTPQQMRLVRGVGGEQSRIYFFFDGDRAGRQAALRSFGVCAEAGVWGRPAFLPDGMDPDDFVRERGVDDTLAVLDRAPELLDFYFDETLPPGADLPTRTRAAKEVKRLLERVSDPVQLDLLVHQAAARLGVSEVVLAGRDPSSRTRTHGASQSPRNASSYSQQGSAYPRQASSYPQQASSYSDDAQPYPEEGSPEIEEGAAEEIAWPVEERMLLEVVALDEDVARVVLDGDVVGSFLHAGLAAAVSRLVDGWEASGGVGAVVDGLPSDIASHLSGVLVNDEELDRATRMQVAEDCMARIRKRTERERRRALVAELRRAERDGDADSETQVLRSLQEMRRREGERL